jgi:protein-tyrosine phosphatase
MARLLFVCSGNTCRSPLAAAQARALANQHVADVVVASAGTSAVDGQPASGHAQTVAKLEGLDLREHRSARIALASIESADLVLTMTAAHRDALHREWPRYRDRVLTLGEAAGVDADVTDPFGGTVEDYEMASREIARLLRAAWPAISRRLAI